MPYISITTPQNLSEALRDTIKKELGSLITVIPGKTEADLLVNFPASTGMFMGGKEVNSAFVDLRMYKKAGFEAKKKFTEGIFDLLTRELDIKKEHIYLTIMEFEDWGYDGTLNQ